MDTVDAVIGRFESQSGLGTPHGEFVYPGYPWECFRHEVWSCCNSKITVGHMHSSDHGLRLSESLAVHSRECSRPSILRDAHEVERLSPCGTEGCVLCDIRRCKEFALEVIRALGLLKYCVRSCQTFEHFVAKRDAWAGSSATR